MPYIHPHSRSVMREALAHLKPHVHNTGDLQYIIAELVQHYLESREVVNYSELENVMGAIAGAQHEFQRQVVDKYEDLKIKENGPVYNTNMYRLKGY